MNPAGMTNVTIGMMWGWHSLTPSEPFTQAQYDVQVASQFSAVFSSIAASLSGARLSK